jgi:hypothetical protein
MENIRVNTAQLGKAKNQGMKIFGFFLTAFLPKRR